jgi:hypothetical protein
VAAVVAHQEHIALHPQQQLVLRISALLESMLLKALLHPIRHFRLSVLAAQQEKPLSKEVFPVVHALIVQLALTQPLDQQPVLLAPLAHMAQQPDFHRALVLVPSLFVL